MSDVIIYFGGIVLFFVVLLISVGLASLPVTISKWLKTKNDKDIKTFIRPFEEFAGLLFFFAQFTLVIHIGRKYLHGSTIFVAIISICLWIIAIILNILIYQTYTYRVVDKD